MMKVILLKRGRAFLLTSSISFNNRKNNEHGLEGYPRLIPYLAFAQTFFLIDRFMKERRDFLITDYR